VALGFSSDGALLAVADEEGGVRFWDWTEGRPVGPPLADAPPYLNGFSFSQNGLLATGGAEGFAIWRVSDGSLINSFNTASFVGAPLIAALNPEGSLLATSSFYGRGGIEIWDGNGVLSLGPSLGDKASALEFAPREATLAAIQGSELTTWDFNLQSWQARACRIANRNLTMDEWQQYMGDRPYNSTCDGQIAPP